MSERRSRDCAKPINSFDDALRQNFEKGVVKGLQIACQFPLILYKERTITVQQLIEDLQNEQSDSS